MDKDQIIITSELNEKQQGEALRILYKSFALKFPNLWIYNKTEEQAIKLLEKSVDYKYGIYAILNDRVIGILGLDLGKGKRFMEFSLCNLTSTFGWIGGFMRYMHNLIEDNFVHSKANDKQSRIHPIAVSPEARGKGVGSLLLSAFEQNSRKLGNSALVLEVVDTNPKAKKLYEKEGYVAYKYAWTALFTKKAGFSGFYYMKKSLMG